MADNNRFAFDVIYAFIRYGELAPAKQQLDNIAVRLQLKLQGLTEQNLKSSAQRALRHDAGESNFIRGLIAARQNDKREAISLFQAAERDEFPARDSLPMGLLAEALFHLEEYPLSIQAYEIYLKHFPLDTMARTDLALSYHATGSFAKALENFQKVLAQAPHSPKLHFYLGLTLLEEASNEEGRRQFQEELKIDPQSYQAMAALAYLDYLNGDNEHCLQWLEKARPLNPNWVETNMVFGLLYNRLGQFDRAIQVLEQTVKEKPNHQKAHYQLALAYRRIGNERKAKENADIYERLTQADTATAGEGLLQEGLQAYGAHQLTTALAKLRQAYKQAPGNAKVRLALGLILYETDSASAEAQELMESVAPQFPDNFELQLKLLDSYLQTRNELKLASLLDRLQTTPTNNSRFVFNVTYTLVRYGQLEPAKRLLDKLSSNLQPALQGVSEDRLKSPAQQARLHEAGEVYFIRGMIAASQGDKSEAMRLFQAADRYDFPARDSLQMQMLAEALFRLEEYSLSIQAYEAYLKYFPLDSAARMNLALGYYSTASLASAKENFQKVLDQAPQTPSVHLYLGLTLLELKSNEEARQHFEEELKAEPKSYQAMAELAYLAYLEGDNDRCRQWLEKAKPLNPEWVETNVVFGLLYNRLGQFDLAIQFLEEAVKERPNHYKAHYQLALAYRRSGNEIKAREQTAIYDQLVAAEKARQLGDKSPKN